MLKASDEQIEILARALRESPAQRGIELSQLVGEGESLEFYHGLISGLLIAHQLLMTRGGGDQILSQLLSLAAARASEQYLQQKKVESSLFPEFIDTE